MPELPPDIRKGMSIRLLQQRLQQEQLAFDPGDPEYDEYQAKLDSVASKSEALTQARRVRPSPPVRT